MAGTVSYFNLTGGLNTIQGLGTINQSNKRTESPDMKNVEYYKLGGLISMNGNTQFGSTFDSPISLGYEYIYGNNKYMIIVTTNSEVFIYDRPSGSFKLIFKFENKNNRHSICSFNNGIVMSNGIDDLVFYQYGRKDLIASEVSTTGTDSKVTGTNTKFLTSLSVGDYVIFGNDEDTLDNKYRVVSIDSDTQLTLDRNYPKEQVFASLYLSDLSACNAVFKTQGDNPKETNVRGLALNSYNGRIFVGGTDGILYYSEVGLIHGWSQEFGAGAIPAFYDDNSDFTALGLFDKYLIIFKRERCYLLDGNDVDDTNWTVTPYSLYTCDSQQSWIDADSSLLVYSRNAGGIYPVLKRTIYNPIYQGSELSMKIRDSFQFINEAMFDYIFPVYHPEKKYVMFYVPLLTGKGSNTAFIYDVTSKTWLKREVPQNVTIAFRFDNEIYIGTTEGKILKEFSGLTFDGTPIEFYWKSPSFTFGQGTNFLSAREFRIKMSEEYTNNFRIRNSKDGKTTYTERKINSNENAFIGLVWDVGYNPNGQNPEYTNLKASYSLTSSAGDTTYYTDVLSTNVNSWMVKDNVPIYSDVNCTELVGYSGLITQEYQTDNPQVADRIERIPVKGYEWDYSYSEFVRYTNGTDYLWVYYQDGHPQVGRACKISRKPTTEVVKYALVGFAKNNVGKTAWLYVAPEEYKTAQAALASGGEYELHPTYSDGTYATDQVVAIKNRQFVCINKRAAWVMFTEFNSSANITAPSSTASGSNIDEATNTTITAATETTDGVWSVTAGGVTFTNLSNVVSDGEMIYGKLYSKTDTITNGTDLYANTECTLHAAEGQEPSGGNNIVLLDGFERQVSVSGGSQYYFSDYEYFVKVPILYNYQVSDDGNGLTYNARVFNKITLYDVDDTSNYILIDVTSLEPPKTGDTVEVHTGDTVTNEQIVNIDGLETKDVVLVTNNNTYNYKQYENGGTKIDSYITNLYLNNNKAYLDIDNKRYIGDVTDKVIKPSWCYQRLGTVIHDALSIETINDPTRIELPDLTNYIEESITDTVWDEDSWVVSSYITKRFPLMNQIFQTMSVEFYGNGLNDGMCIYGFEIDGVQLEEVPW